MNAKSGFEAFLPEDLKVEHEIYGTIPRTFLPIVQKNFSHHFAAGTFDNVSPLPGKTIKGAVVSRC